MSASIGWVLKKRHRRKSEIMSACGRIFGELGRTLKSLCYNAGNRHALFVFAAYLPVGYIGVISGRLPAVSSWGRDPANCGCSAFSHKARFACCGPHPGACFVDPAIQDAGPSPAYAGIYRAAPGCPEYRSPGQGGLLSLGRSFTGSAFGDRIRSLPPAAHRQRRPPSGRGCLLLSPGWARHHPRRGRSSSSGRQGGGFHPRQLPIRQPGDHRVCQRGSTG
jgi:hypothetical protein